MRLRRSDPAGPGFRRRRVGRGFTYVDETGRRIDDPEVLARIRALAIPPAWTDVWICAAANGHIQATGVDDAGRRQYRYHDVWRQRRDREKFEHMLDVARALPRLRRVCARELAREGLDRDRVLACAVRLLDLGFFRIGCEGYAEANQSYGLATMRRSHVRMPAGDLVVFDYRAKSGRRRIQSVVDAEVADVVRALKARQGGGRELLAWWDDASGRWNDVRSVDINTWVRAAAGADVTAKDFRTWSATVLAAVALAVSREAASPTARKRAVTRAYQEVAHYLGNTPAVAKASYVDPRVVDLYLAGVTIDPAVVSAGATSAGGPLGTQGRVEAAVLALLAEGRGVARRIPTIPPAPVRRRSAARAA